MAGKRTKNQDHGDAANAVADRMSIDYIKSLHFRTIAPTGSITSITPIGLVQLALYSERQPIPQRVVHAIQPNGELGDIIDIIGRDAIVREVEAAITLEPDLARALAIRILDLVKELTDETSEK